MVAGCPNILLTIATGRDLLVVVKMDGSLWRRRERLAYLVLACRYQIEH